MSILEAEVPQTVGEMRIQEEALALLQAAERRRTKRDARAEAPTQPTQDRSVAEMIDPLLSPTTEPNIVTTDRGMAILIPR